MSTQLYSPIKGDILQTDIKGMQAKEVENYKEFVAHKNGGSLKGIASITVKNVDNDNVDITWTTKGKFERIRRITGYLTGSLDRWNDAKQAEEHDRVKHSFH